MADEFENLNFGTPNLNALMGFPPICYVSV